MDCYSFTPFLLKDSSCIFKSKMGGFLYSFSRYMFLISAAYQVGWLWEKTSKEEEDDQFSHAMFFFLSFLFFSFYTYSCIYIKRCLGDIRQKWRDDGPNGRPLSNSAGRHFGSRVSLLYVHPFAPFVSSALSICMARRL